MRFLGCLISGGEETSPPIGEALTDDALQGFYGAFCVGAALGIVAKIELGGLAAQMGLSDVMINTDDPTLEDAEEILGGVGVEVAVAGGVFASALRKQSLSPGRNAPLGAPHLWGR